MRDWFSDVGDRGGDVGGADARDRLIRHFDLSLRVNREIAGHIGKFGLNSLGLLLGSVLLLWKPRDIRLPFLVEPHPELAPVDIRFAQIILPAHGADE